MKKIYNLLKSKKLTILLLLFLAAISIIGTIFSYEKTDSQEFSLDSTKWLSYFKAIQFYHSPIFVLTLALLALNLIVCIYDRLKANWRKLIKVYFEVEEEYIKNLPFHYFFLTDLNKTILEKNLIKEGFKISKSHDLLYAEKGWINVWGTYIIHISIILIILAGAISSLFGFVGTVGIFEEKETNRYYNWTHKKYMDLPFTIRVEKLNVTYYPVSIEAEAGDGINRKKYTLKKGDEFIYKNDRFVFSEFLPDCMVMNNEVYSVSESLYIPAVLFKIYKGQEFISNYWIFEKDIGYVNKIKLPYSINILKSQYLPKSNESIINIFEQGELKIRDTIRPNKPISYKKLNIYFWGIGQDDYRNYFTGFQIIYDPSIWLIWIGLGGILTGIFVVFFIPYDRIWFKLSMGGILFGGKTSGDNERFKNKMEKLAGKIKEGIF